MKERSSLSRREFLKLASSLPLIALKERGAVNTPLDLTPEKKALTSVWPIDESPEKSLGDGQDPSLGYRHLQVTYNNWRPDGGHHIGIDLNKGDYDEDLDNVVRVPLGGVCVFVSDENKGYELGNIVILCHQLTNSEFFYTRFAHLSAVTIRVGENYEPGEILGLIGKSGMAGIYAHLHLDVARRLTFLERLIENPYWYPHLAPLNFIEKYFVDPLEIIEPLLDNSPRERRRGSSGKDDLFVK